MGVLTPPETGLGRHRASLSAGAVLVLWSGSGVFSYLATNTWSALQAAWWESLCGFLLVVVFARAIQLPAKIAALTKRDTLRLTILGLLAHTGYYSFLFLGFSSGYQVQTMALNYTWAVFMVLFGVGINRITFRWHQGLSVLLGAAGAVIVVLAPSQATARFSVGALAGLGAGLCFGLFTPLFLRWSYDPRLVTSWMLGVSFVVFSIAMALSPSKLTITPRGLVGAAYMGICVDFVGYFLWQRANRGIKSWVIAVWACAIPFLNVSLLAIVFDLDVPRSVYLGAGFIVAALVVQNVPKLTRAGVATGANG